MNWFQAMRNARFGGGGVQVHSGGSCHPAFQLCNLRNAAQALPCEKGGRARMRVSGGSVASARLARLSMIMLTHSICGWDVQGP